MLDTAAIIISQGKKIAYAYAEGVNDNMTQSHFHVFLNYTIFWTENDCI